MRDFVCWCFFGLALLDWHPSARADEQGEEPLAQPDAVSAAVEKQLTSADHRQQARADLAAEVGVVVLPSMGFSLGGYLGPNDVLEGAAAFGVIDLGIVRAESSLLDLRYKRFWANSFYTNLSAGMRTVRATSPLLDALSGRKAFEAKASDFAIGISIGNRWQWQHFLIGCDWLGVHVPIFKRSSSVTSSADFGNDKEYDRRKSDWDGLSKAVTPQLLRFYLGVVF